MSQFGTFTIDGRKHDLDDFSLGDLEEVENLCQRKVQMPDGSYLDEPTPFAELNFSSTKVLRAFAYVVLRRENPEFTYDDTLNIKLVSFMEGEEDIPDTGPPADTGKMSQPNGSDPEGSGVLASDTQHLG